MIFYRVTIILQPGIESEWVNWMQQVHIPDVLKTGYFEQCRMFRELEASEPTFVMEYQCRSLEDYQRYREQHAPALQKEHTERYAGRFRGTRQLLECLSS
ncbi:MAG: DUF4286 family protein [Planctomycetia bacterium]|nr:DUF4286 family protein [Planctomycetia bacterium]